MLVSFVIPAYQAEATLRYSVASALAQHGVEVEVLIADDGSTDGTAAAADALAARDARVRVLHGPNRGPSGARNAAIEAAAGELVAFLDADDLVLPGYAARLADRLRCDAALGFAFCDAWVYDSEAARFWRQTLLSGRGVPQPMPASAGATYELLLRDNFVYVGAVAHRAALLEVGGWDETMRTSEDWDLWLRLLRAGHGAAFVDEPLAVYRRWPAQASADAGAMAAGRAELWRRHGHEPAVADGAGGASALVAAARRHMPARLRGTRFYRRSWPAEVRSALREYRLDELWGERPR